MAFPRKPWTFSDYAELKQLVQSGLNRIEIARRINRGSDRDTRERVGDSDTHRYSEGAGPVERASVLRDT